MFVSGGTRHVGERDQRNSTHCHNVCVCEIYPATSRPFAPSTIISFKHLCNIIMLLKTFTIMYILLSDIIISFKHLCNIIMLLKTFTNMYILLIDIIISFKHRCNNIMSLKTMDEGPQFFESIIQSLKPSRNGICSRCS